MEKQPDSRLQQQPVFTDLELHAYVNGGLNAARRAEISGFLACNPDLAAGVMQAIHHRERQRVFLRDTPRRAHRQLRGLRVALACLLCAAAGWAVAEGLDDDGPFRDLSTTPEYVDDAIMAQRVAKMRSAMHSQPETTRLDAGEIARATGIRMPPLPQDVRLLDAQIYPSDEGPTVSIVMETAPRRTLSLFAVRADTAAKHIPRLVSRSGEYAVFWEADGSAYVLSGAASSDELHAHAHRLAGQSPF